MEKMHTDARVETVKKRIIFDCSEEKRNFPRLDIVFLPSDRVDESNCVCLDILIIISGLDER